MSEDKNYVAVIENTSFIIDKLGVIVDKPTFIQQANPSVKEDLEKIIDEDVVLMKELNRNSYVFEIKKPDNKQLVIGSLDYVTNQLKLRQDHLNKINKKYDKAISLLNEEKPSIFSTIYMAIVKYMQIFRGIF